MLASSLRNAFMALALLVGLAVPAAAQVDYLECTACQIMLGLVESSYGPGGGDIVVDASKQCALLGPADREACARFYSTYGPKFIKIIKERKAKGESLDQICKSMGYCR